MLDDDARRRQRWLLFAGRRPLLPPSRRAGFLVSSLWFAAVAGLIALTVGAVLHNGGPSAAWPLAVAGAPWTLVVVITSPAWGGFTFSNTPDWVVVAVFGVPALVNSSVVGGLVARWLDNRRRRRQRLANSASARS